MFAIAVLILFAGRSCTWASKYNFVLEDSDIFTECEVKPPGSIGIRGVFDMDNLVFEPEEDGVHVSGNFTATLNYSRTDRITARFQVMQYNRGSWDPTLYSMMTPDLCSVLFSESQYYYQYWFKNVVNREEIQEKCIITRNVGMHSPWARLSFLSLVLFQTTVILKPFVMNLRLENVRVPVPLRGRFKVVYTFTIYDENDVQRPTNVCFEIRGELIKINSEESS
ncbi:uncharacterized protein LOC108091266 isoform X1 [Drosophila ficusphila]|uniref:uncharacterized protein LOC108091266 isoform X1 n=1 Tax=Drosophila ficusphila TaxID=30025 RepID=UPI0007E8304B|nr:uncharacterized protein LOC108091266 isoform X1 [Drosophila ficusphila]